jgi:hypothetical protein
MTNDANLSPRDQWDKHGVPYFPRRVTTNRTVSLAANAAIRPVKDTTLLAPVVVSVKEYKHHGDILPQAMESLVCW